MKVSLFKNFNRVEQNLELGVILDQIRGGKYKAKVLVLRELVRHGKLDEYNDQKRSLPGFTPSGLFEGGRKLQHLKEYSGVLVLDLDDLTQDQLVSIRSRVEEIHFTYACFISPGGQGLKILVRVFSRPVLHKQAFNQVKDYYERELNVLIDPSGKDVTRLCFVSWDETLYLNPSSAIFKTYVNVLEEDIDKVVRKIEEKKIDITVDYDTWIRIAFALTDALGEEGRTYFHRVSRFYPDYNESDCNLQFDRCLHAGNTGITSASFFHFARDQGIDISSCRSFKETSEQPIANSEQQTTKPETRNPKRETVSSLQAIETFLKNRYAFRYNIVTSKIEYRPNANLQPLSLRDSRFAGVEATSFVPLTDYLENSLFRELLTNNLKCPQNTLRSLLLSDFCPRYDPFEDYFNSLFPWDGSTDHIRDLADTVQTTNDDLWQVCFKRWLVASVASLLDTEVVNHTAIIFSGPQGIGKTTWLLNLCPPRLKNYIFSGTINPNNRDTLIHLSECAFINLDELENMSRSEIGTVKEIITKSAIRVRRAYGFHNESLVRRASFMGSVNTTQFLTDTTGSRRFLCFEVLAIDYLHSVEINEVYAQAYALWKSSFQYWFNPGEAQEINRNNEQFLVCSPEEELLLAHFAPVTLSKARRFLSAAQIISEVSEDSVCNLSLNPGSIIRMGLALKKYGFEKKKSNGLHHWGVEVAQREEEVQPPLIF
ncbi:MAG: virulence-associated E family protein [Bacteroidetes bacterium]|nr:MAG: virulence-associated E family protein [Bacteroidota bacterium]